LPVPKSVDQTRGQKGGRKDRERERERERGRGGDPSRERERKWEWGWRVPGAVMAEMQKRRFYDTTSPVDLIFFARNLLEHIPAADTAAWHAMAGCGHGGGGGGGEGERGPGTLGDRGLVEPRSRAVAFLEATFPGLNLLVYTWNKALRKELRASVRSEGER
jgi:hypothetical protein